MKSRSIFIIWVAATMLLALVSNAADKPEDATQDVIVDSFERELNHEAPQPKNVTRDAIDNDVLYDQINKPLQTPEAVPSSAHGE